MDSSSAGLLIVLQLFSTFLSHASAFVVERQRRNAELDISQLLGSWHDVLRTTYMWGPETWPSQRWNFVQGQDGTMLALFNAWCNPCGACSKTFVYTVTRKEDTDFPTALSLEVYGETISLWVEGAAGSEMVVSMCFDSEVPHPDDCPQDKFQMSVLSREASTSLEDIPEVLRELLPDVTYMDASAGEKECPSLFADSELVTARFAERVRYGSVDTQSVVGVLGSRVRLPCTLSGDQESNETKVSWVRDEDSTSVPSAESILQNSRYRVRQSRTKPHEWELRIRDVSLDDAGVYACTTQQNEIISRVVLSVAVPPAIVSKSDDVGVAAGSSVELECEASGRPTPVTSWYFLADNQTGSGVFVADGERLLLENFTAASEGGYVCRASNDVESTAESIIFVHALPEITVEIPSVYSFYGDSAELVCRIQTRSLANAWWRKGTHQVGTDGRLRQLDLSVESEGMFVLTLTLREISKEDFGQYACVAENRGGVGEASVVLTELTMTGKHCYIDNIPVMPDFNIQEFVGSWERMQATTYFWGNKTYLSQVVGHFVTISGSLLQYYRGYDSESERCLEPGAGSMVQLDTPGNYLMPVNNQRGRFKVVYTDYTHAVVYLCLSGDGQRACPRHKLHVQIMSRLPAIPDRDLRVLYRYVQRACVPVTDLVDTVPGLCQMPAKFLYERGYIGRFPEPNCQVAKLQVPDGFTQASVSGAWHLVAVVLPQYAHYDLRSSIHIVPTDRDLAIFYRGFDFVTGLCTSPEVIVLHMSDTPGSYYHDYPDLTKSITVDAKFLYVSETSLVLYTCLTVQLDGSCYSGSQIVEVYHRSPNISHGELLWLKRPLVQACVDIGKIVQPVVDDCPVPASVLTAADTGLLKNDHAQIGCHHSFISTADNFSENEFAGDWLTMYRTGYDMGTMDCSNGRNTNGETASACDTGVLLSDYSKTTQVVKSADGRLLVLSRQYNSTAWKACPPAEVLELTSEGRPGNYVFTHLSQKGFMKVLYADNTTALVYWCRRFRTDGVCHEKSLVVEILARWPDARMSEEKLHALRQRIVNVCVGVDDVMPTAAQNHQCTIPDRITQLAVTGEIAADYDIPVVACNGELLRGMPGVDAEKLVGKWNVVQHRGHLRDNASPFAESSYLVLTYTGLIYLWRSYDTVLGRCKPEEAGQFVRTSGPGDYYCGFDGWPVAMKILYADSVNMLVLWCHINDDNQCHPGHTTVTVLSRLSEISTSTVKEMLDNFNDSCLTDQEWVISTPGACKVENDVLTAAFIDGIGLEYSRIGCRRDLIQGQQGVTDDMVVGQWTSILKSQPSMTTIPAARVAFHFIKLPDGEISVLYRLYNAENAECLPAVLMSMQREAGTDSASFAIGQEGVAKILYAEDNVMAVLICMGFLRDDTCDPATQIFVVLVRDGSGVELDKAILESMERVGADVCIAPESVVQPSLEPCPIPSDILLDATTGQLQTDYAPVQCFTQYIPMQKDFDIRELTGAWYTQWETQDGGQGSDSPLVRSTGFHFVSRQDGTLVMLYAPENPSSPGSCLPARLQVLETGQRNGEFTFLFQNSRALLKIVWLDDERAVTYWCFKSDVIGQCEDVHLSVLSRRPGQETGALPFHLLPTIADCCVSKSDLINAGGCGVPDDIVQAAQNESRIIQAPFSVIECAQEFIPVMDNLDVDLFSGMWHTVRQTKFIWGNATWESLLRTFVPHADGAMLMAFTGQQTDKRTCVPTEVHTLQPDIVPGQWTYLEGDNAVLVKLVWTDYASSALLYTCNKVGADGPCHRGGLQVEYLSRTTRLQAGVEGELARLTPMLCVGMHEVEPIQTGLCKITEVVAHAVKLGSGGAGDTEKSVSCRIRDIPLSTNFRFLQMRGYWHEIARTRFTFNNMESTISYYEPNTETGNLDGLFIGSLQNQCQSALKSVTKKRFPSGPESVMMGRIQGPENVFPWITFNIIYFDGSFMAHVACYAENPDGTCPKGMTEVTLLGRSRQLDAEMEAKLDGLMESVCLSREDLVATKETDNCLPMLRAMVSGQIDLPDTEGCPLNDIKVVTGLNEQELFGTWYGLASVDYGTHGDPVGFVVSVSRSTSQSLLWRQWYISEGSCEAEKGVYVKTACLGDNTGDYLSTRGSSFMMQWSTLKILRFENDMMLVYWCTKETEAGACDPEGVRVDLLGRSRETSLDVMIPLLSSLSSACLAPEHLKPVETADACDGLAAVVSPAVEVSSCAVSLLPAVSVDGEKLFGVWYEMSHTVDPMFPLQKAVVHYRTQADDQLSMFLAAVGPDGECKGPMEGRMKPRCHSNPDANFLGRLKFPGMWSWASWHLLYVDYNTSAIVLSCMDEQGDGSCSAQGSKLFILTRDLNPSPALRQQLYGVLRDMRCFDKVPMQNVVHKGLSCEDKLAPVLAPPA